MQVHKETIDRIPNALPNRNSVDIEIYGMEGIPENDIREHEKSRGSDYVPPPAPSASTAAFKSLLPTTVPLLAPAPLLPPVLPTTVGGLPMAPFPVLPAYPPPPATIPLPAFPPPPLGPPPGQPPVAFQMSLPRKPLFPAAASALLQQPPPPLPQTSVASAQPVPSSQPQTAPVLPPEAPSPVAVSAGAATASDSVVTPTAAGAPLVPPASGSSRIVHPDEDLSLEELRARLPRYQLSSQAAHRTSSTVY